MDAINMEERDKMSHFPHKKYFTGFSLRRCWAVISIDSLNVFLQLVSVSTFP